MTWYKIVVCVNTRDVVSAEENGTIVHEDLAALVIWVTEAKWRTTEHIQCQYTDSAVFLLHTDSFLGCSDRWRKKFEFKCSSDLVLQQVMYIQQRQQMSKWLSATKIFFFNIIFLSHKNVGCRKELLVGVVTKHTVNFKDVFELRGRIVALLPTFFRVLFELTLWYWGRFENQKLNRLQKEWVTK